MKNIGLLIRSLFWGVALCVLPSTQVIAASEQKVEHLSKEIKELNQSFKKVQERLAGIAKQVETMAPSALGNKSSPMSSGVQYIERITHHLKLRFQEFIQGLEDVFQLLHTPLPEHFSLHMLHFFVSIAVGSAGVYVGHFFIRRRIMRLLEHLHSKRIAPLNRLAILLASLALPLAGFFLLSVTVLFLFENIRQRFVDFPDLYSQRYALLPLDLYVLWAGSFGIKLLFSEGSVSQLLLPLTPVGRKEAAFWMRFALFTYIAGKMALYVFGVFPNNTSILLTVSSTLGLVVSFALGKALLLMRMHLLQHPAYTQTVRGLTILRWTVFFFGGCWLLTRRWFNYFLVPVLTTDIAMAMVTPLQNLVAYWRVSYFWKHRGKQTLLKPLLQNAALLETSVRYGIYGILSLIWVAYLWDFYDFGWFLTITQWIQSVLFSPFAGNLFNAIIIFFCSVIVVKGAEKLLKFYVEEKYPAESENNFLASRLKTLMAMLRTLVRIVVWLPAISIILAQFGEINITAWITSIGAASFGLTFGFQTIVRDFVTGFFIILENNLMVGDEVDVDGRTGKVEEITMRTLKIRSDSGVLLTIPFSNIVVIGNKNRQFSAVVINISIGYNENVDKVQGLIEKAFTTLKRTPILGRRIIGNLELRGINEVTSFSVVIQIKIKTAPNMQESIRRAYTRILKQLFDEAGVVVPVPPYAPVRGEPNLTHTII